MKHKRMMIIFTVLILCLSGCFWKKKTPDKKNNNPTETQTETNIEISDEVVIPVDEDEESFGE